MRVRDSYRACFVVQLILGPLYVLILQNSPSLNLTDALVTAVWGNRFRQDIDENELGPSNKRQVTW